MRSLARDSPGSCSLLNEPSGSAQLDLAKFMRCISECCKRRGDGMGRRRPMAQNGFPLRIGFCSFPASIQARKGPVQRYVIDEFEFPIEELDIDPIGASVTGQKPDVLGVFHCAQRESHRARQQHRRRCDRDDQISIIEDRWQRQRTQVRERRAEEPYGRSSTDQQPVRVARAL